MTQDLNRTRFIMWVNDFSDLTSNPDVKAFFDNFHPYVQLRRIKWEQLIADTPFEHHSYFGNFSLLRETLHRACVSDLLRLLLVYHFGGVWVRCAYVSTLSRQRHRLTTIHFSCGTGDRW